MEKYLGVKLIDAESEPKFYSEWEEDLDKAQDGYKVVYEDGYESWSPKDVFEKAYLKFDQGNIEINGKLEPHQERVVVEAAELGEKLNKLEYFIYSDIFDKNVSAAERDLLRKQLMGMKYYLIALMERIKLF